MKLIPSFGGQAKDNSFRELSSRLSLSDFAEEIDHLRRNLSGFCVAFRMRFVRFGPRIIPKIFPTCQQVIFAFALPYQKNNIKGVGPHANSISCIDVWHISLSTTENSFSEYQWCWFLCKFNQLHRCLAYFAEHHREL
jgi:hypothetical protein